MKNFLKQLGLSIMLVSGVIAVVSMMLFAWDSECNYNDNRQKQDIENVQRG